MTKTEKWLLVLFIATSLHFHNDYGLRYFVASVVLAVLFVAAPNNGVNPTGTAPLENQKS